MFKTDNIHKNAIFPSFRGLFFAVTGENPPTGSRNLDIAKKNLSRYLEYAPLSEVDPECKSKRSVIVTEIYEAPLLKEYDGRGKQGKYSTYLRPMLLSVKKFDGKSGLYLYASTEAILCGALRKMRLGMEKPQRIEVNCGDILKIDQCGIITRGTFDADVFYWPSFQYTANVRKRTRKPNAFEREYLDELKSVAAFFGYSPDHIDEALRRGYTMEDIEEWLNYGRL